MFDVYFVAKNKKDIPLIKSQLSDKEFYGDRVYVVSNTDISEDSKTLVFRDVEPDKERAVYLDHAGNVRNHGFPEDIIPDSLHEKSQEYKERKLTKDKKEPKVKECPQCFQEMVGVRCKCGYEIPMREQIVTDDQELKKITEVKQKDWNKITSKEDKEKLYGMLKYYAAQNGYKQGWADYRYKAKAGVWPNKYKNADPIKPDNEFLQWIAA